MPYDDATPESNIILTCGFATPLALLLLYFLWENGPLHRSRLVEGQYLSLSLMLILIADFTWARLNDRKTTSQRIIFGIMLLSVLHIIDNSFSQSTLRRLFFGQRKNARQQAKKYIPKETYMSALISARLDDAISETLELVKTKSRFNFLTNKTTFGPCLLAVAMLHDISYTSKSISIHVEPVLKWTGVAMFSYWVLGELRRICLLYPKSAEIHDLVSDLVMRGESDTLRYVLCTCNIPTLVEVALQSTVMLLVRQSLDTGILCVTSKAILVDALQKRGLRHSTTLQMLVHDILLSCRAGDLTTLKTLIDGSGSFQNLYKLIYNDITKKSCREAILLHIRDQAKATRNALGRRVGIKVLSDVDDTLYSSGGHFPAGCDKRYPKHAVYPGCLHLFEVLDQEWTAQPLDPCCNLVFLSARPHVYKAYAESKSYKLFQDLLQRGRMHSCPTLLPGRLRQGLQAILLTLLCFKTSAWRAVGQLKCATYFKFRDLYREYDFLFFGDNGQGDQLAGQLMMSQSAVNTQDAFTAPEAQGPQLLAVVMHRVMSDESSLAMEPSRQRRESWLPDLAQKGVLISSSYIRAAMALHVHNPDLISLNQLQRVTLGAMEDFEKLAITHTKWRASPAGLAAEREMQADVEEVNSWMQAANLPAMRKLDSSTSLLAYQYGARPSKLGMAMMASTSVRSTSSAKWASDKQVAPLATSSVVPNVPV